MNDSCYNDNTDDISIPFDQYIGQYARVPFGEQTAVVKILNKQKKFDTNLKGETDVYTARLPDGSEREYTKNMVAENLFAQCDGDGNMIRLVDEIILIMPLMPLPQKRLMDNTILWWKN